MSGHVREWNVQKSRDGMMMMMTMMSESLWGLVETWLGTYRIRRRRLWRWTAGCRTKELNLLVSSFEGVCVCMFVRFWELYEAWLVFMCKEGRQFPQCLPMLLILRPLYLYPSLLSHNTETKPASLLLRSWGSMSTGELHDSQGKCLWLCSHSVFNLLTAAVEFSWMVSHKFYKLLFFFFTDKFDFIYSL